MLPYQAMAMDYAVSSSFQRHPGSAVNMNMNMNSMNMNMNPAAAAFSHSWFVPADLCVPFKSTQPLLEPGILELRKEKSRDAARSRRGKENYEFYELAKMLPLPAAITSQLDKASIIRLTISYLKLRDFSGHGDPPWSREGPSISKNMKSTPLRSRSPNSIAIELFEQHQGTHILQSLDGFAFALAADGRFLYISETVSIYLGLSQVEMTGSSLFDYVHQADHSEVAEQLGLGLTQPGQGGVSSPSSANSEEGVSNTGTANPDVSSIMSVNSTSSYRGMDRSFCVRMKSTLTKRGCHFKSSGYRVVLLLCRLRPQYTFSHTRKTTAPLLGAISLAIALPPPTVHEIRLESDMFVTRVNFDFTIAHCEPRVIDLLDYTAEELTGMNLYTLCHGQDVNKLRKCHVDLINKGQMITHYFRIMNKNGGYTWIQTCATVVCNSKNNEEQNIICINYVVSGKEYENVVMDCCQLEESISHATVKREELGGNDPENGSPNADSAADNRTTNSSGKSQINNSDIEESSRDASGCGTSRMDHVTTQLHSSPHLEQIGGSVLNAQMPRKLSPNGKQMTGAIRRTHKRKLSTPLHRDDDEGESSSCCSSDEEERLNNNTTSRTKQYAATSPGLTAIPPSPKPMPHEESETSTATSVKDIENAMSKHLPPAAAHDKASPSLMAQPTDFSADALLKQQQKSTIQWIGAHHHHINHLSQQHVAHAPGSTIPTTFPAQAFLRQLSLNRESVIRANVHSVSNPSRNGPSPGSYYSSDVNNVGPLPTPPGSEGSYNDQFALSHSQKPNDGYNGLVSSYATSGSYPVDYHTAMTPPSSVSPRDKHQHAIHNTNGNSFDGGVYNDVLRHQYLGSGDMPSQPLPLKPQAYTPVHASALDAAYAASSLDQSQFYHSSGFHIYHPTNKANSSPMYTDGLKNHSNWYPTPT